MGSDGVWPSHLPSAGATEAVISAAGNARRPEARLCPVDFGDLAEVRRMAETIAACEPRLDVLVNNAGIITDQRQESVDGHELTF